MLADLELVELVLLELVDPMNVLAPGQAVSRSRPKEVQRPLPIFLRF